MPRAFDPPAAAPRPRSGLRLGPPDDACEREADRMAEAVTAAEPGGPGIASAVARTPPSLPPAVQRLCPQCEEEQAGGALQRKCAACAAEEESLQAEAAGPAAAGAAPEVPAATADRIGRLRGGGAPLPPDLRAYFEPRLGRDLAPVRLHTGGEAAAAAREVRARAFTVGPDIAFGLGELQPESAAGRRLLAHELVHTIQQGAAGEEGGVVQRQGDPQQQPASTPSPPTPPVAPAPLVPAFTGTVELQFDGVNLTILDGGKAAATLPATSGRPTEVDAADVTKCKGTTGEVYVNNPRYVGIKDRGAIPEGTYEIRPSELMELSESEQVDLLEGAAQQKKTVKIRGVGLHPGDWGRGRIELHAKKVLPGPAGCGDTAKRNAFFLHGGVLRGSAGCIDIGTAMDDLAAQLRGHTKNIKVTVAYSASAGATLTKCELLLGDLFYKGKMDPGLLTCIPSLTGSSDPEAASVWTKLIARLMPGGGSGTGTSTTTPPAGSGALDKLKDLWPF